MTSKMRYAPRWVAPLAMLGLVATSPGCGFLDEHRKEQIPHLGIIDPEQPRELRKVSLPPHVVEPPDELEITIRPASIDLLSTTLTVQPDGAIDLGFYGDVYVAGLTLADVERKIEQHVAAIAQQRQVRLQEAVRASVRVVNASQSKRYYVLGTVVSQGSFPLTGNETVLDAMLLAGLRSNSLPDRAYISRPQPDGVPPLNLRVEWEQIRMGNTLTNYQLMPGDRVNVPGGRPPSIFSRQ